MKIVEYILVEHLRGKVLQGRKLLELQEEKEVPDFDLLVLIYFFIL